MSNSNSYIVTHTVKTLDSLQESLEDILNMQLEDMKKEEEKETQTNENDTPVSEYSKL